MVRKKGEGLLRTSCLDIEQLPDDARNIVRNSSSPEEKRVRINCECLYLLNPLYHEEHNFFGSSFCSYCSTLWKELSEIAALHGWFQTVFFLVLHVLIVMPLKIVFNPPFIPRKWMHELKVEVQMPPFPGYTEKQRWCFARKLWFNHKAEQIFDERDDGVKVWEGFCFSEKQYLQIREHVRARISYFVERTGSMKEAIAHGLKETDLKVVEDSGLWVVHQALGFRFLPMMTFAEAKSIPGSGFLVRFKWWHLDIVDGWARIHATVEGERGSEEKGIMVVMHLFVLPCFAWPYKIIVNKILELYCRQLKEIVDLCL